MTPQSKQIILIALERYKGDDLQRARQAFAHLSTEEMDSPHGHSGMTRRQVLESYIAHEVRINQAIKEFQG